MTAQVISGKQLAKELRENMKEEINLLKQRGITPHLTVILIGDDPASHSYVNGKKKASEEVGISSEIIKLDATITEDELLDKIKSLIKILMFMEFSFNYLYQNILMNKK